MKIAVLYSGQIRGESYKDNIWHMRKILPEADFFYTTWKGAGDYPWIDHFFDEPHISYNCERYIHKQWLKRLRDLKEEHGFVPQDKPGELGPRKVLSYHIRKTGRDRIKQHLAHALAFEKYCTDKEYDVVIRIRYDLRFENFGREQIVELIRLCYDNNKPASIGYMGEPPEGEISYIENLTAFGDVLICHKGDMFDPQYVYELAERKELKSAEAGWYQILSEPYTQTSYCANCMWAWIERDRWL